MASEKVFTGFPSLGTSPFFHPIEALIRNLPHPGQILVESIDTQAYLCPHSLFSNCP